jgi:hypothetical protein
MKTTYTPSTLEIAKFLEDLRRQSEAEIFAARIINPSQERLRKSETRSYALIRLLMSMDSKLQETDSVIRDLKVRLNERVVECSVSFNKIEDLQQQADEIIELSAIVNEKGGRIVELEIDVENLEREKLKLEEMLAEMEPTADTLHLYEVVAKLSKERDELKAQLTPTKDGWNNLFGDDYFSNEITVKTHDDDTLALIEDFPDCDVSSYIDGTSTIYNHIDYEAAPDGLFVAVPCVIPDDATDVRYYYYTGGLIRTYATIIYSVDNCGKSMWFYEEDCTTFQQRDPTLFTESAMATRNPVIG